MKIEQQTGLNIGLIVMLLIAIMNISKNSMVSLEIYNQMFQDGNLNNINNNNIWQQILDRLINIENTIIGMEVAIEQIENKK